MVGKVLSFKQRDALRLDVADRRDQALQTLEEAVDKALALLAASRLALEGDALRASIEELRHLHRAEDRLAMEEYGLCRDCRGALAFHQLTADPLATQCVPCQQKKP